MMGHVLIAVGGAADSCGLLVARVQVLLVVYILAPLVAGAHRRYLGRLRAYPLANTVWWLLLLKRLLKRHVLLDTQKLIDVFVLGHGCADALREGRKRLWQEVQPLLFFRTQIMAYQFDLSFVLTFLNPGTYIP